MGAMFERGLLFIAHLHFPCPHETKYICIECVFFSRVRGIRGNGLMADCLISLLIMSLVYNPQQAIIVQLEENVLRHK